MAKCGIQTFTQIEPAQFDCLKKKAAAAGIAINGDSGLATRDGITIRWDYDRAEKKLEVQCTDAPFWVSCNAVSSQMADLIENCGPPSKGVGAPSKASRGPRKTRAASPRKRTSKGRNTRPD